MRFEQEYETHGWNQHEMVTRLMEMDHGEERKAQYYQIYGVDPNSPLRWNPQKELPDCSL